MNTTKTAENNPFSGFAGPMQVASAQRSTPRDRPTISAPDGLGSCASTHREAGTGAAPPPSAPDHWTHPKMGRCLAAIGSSQRRPVAVVEQQLPLRLLYVETE